MFTGISIYDSKPFNMLTTAHYPLQKTVGGTKNKERWDIQHSFNKYMNGVDRSDQLQNSYNTYLKSFKWWVRLFYFLLDIAIVNSYLIAKIFNPKLTHLAFRISLVCSIIEKYPHSSGEMKRKSSGGEESVSIKRLGNHLPSIRLSPGNHNPVVGTSRRCKVCTRNGSSSMTSVSCELCDVPLCVKKDSACWAEWHSADFK
jgi:hypothetical protein